MSITQDYWTHMLDAEKEQRESKLNLEAQAYPVRYGCSSGDTLHAWSNVLGSRTRLQKIIDFNVTRESFRKVYAQEK